MKGEQGAVRGGERRRGDEGVRPANERNLIILSKRVDFEKIKSDLTMLVLLSCAKTMSETSKVKVPLKTVPRFQKEASGIALQMSQFSVDELERLLRVNAKIAVENYKRYQAFHAEGTPELPALLACMRFSLTISLVVPLNVLNGTPRGEMWLK